MRLLPSLLLLTACGPGKLELDDTGSVDSADDTAPDTATDSGETGESGDTGETGDTGEPGGDGVVDLAFDIDGDRTGATFNLMAVRADPSGLFAAGAVAAQAVGGARVEVDLAAPDASLLAEVDPINFPGLYACYFIPTLHLDAGGGLAHDDGEAYTAVGAGWALYLDGTPAELTAVGLHDGWNAVEVDPNGELVAVLDPLHVPLEVNLLPAMSVTVSGTYGGEVALDALRLALLPYAAFESALLPELQYDEALTAEWSVTASGEPDAELLVDLEGALADPEVLLAYTDTNGSGGFNLSDVAVYGACSGGASAGAMWLAPPSTFELALAFALNTIPTGWVAARYDGSDLALLTAEEARSLVIDGSCGL